MTKQYSKKVYIRISRLSDKWAGQESLEIPNIGFFRHNLIQGYL